MSTPKPKGPRADAAKVRDIATARSKGGRPSGLGYDPAGGEEFATPTLERKHGADPDYDVFALVGQRGYSEDRFYTKSTDEKGHGEVLRVKLPQGIDAQVYGAVRDVAEYRSLQDLCRDAIVHRLEYLQRRYEISDTSRRFLELERLRADSDRMSQDIDIMRDTVSDLADKLAKAWDAQDFQVLAAELEDANELIDWLREPYSSQVKAMLKDWNDRARQKIAEYRAALDE